VSDQADKKTEGVRRVLKSKQAYALADMLMMRARQGRDHGADPELVGGLTWDAPWGERVHMVEMALLRCGAFGEPHALVQLVGHLALYATVNDRDEEVLALLDSKGEVLMLPQQPESMAYVVSLLRDNVKMVWVRQSEGEWKQWSMPTHGTPPSGQPTTPLQEEAPPWEETPGPSP
jgi:hypothetical protein